MTSKDETTVLLKFKGSQKTIFPLLARSNKFAKPGEIVPVPSALAHKFLGRGDFAEVTEKTETAKKSETKKEG